MIDLKPFCANKTYRPEIAEPFTQGEFTYATNGRILIRVPKREGFGAGLSQDLATTFRWSDIDALPAAGWIKVPELPPLGKACCEQCQYRSIVKDDCEECGGDGFVPEERVWSMDVPPRILAPQYLRMISELPDAVIFPGPEYSHPIDGPMPFRFTGGCGFLMAMRAHAKH